MDAVVAFRITDMIRFPVPAAGVPHPEKAVFLSHKRARHFFVFPWLCGGQPQPVLPFEVNAVPTDSEADLCQNVAELDGMFRAAHLCIPHVKHPVDLQHHWAVEIFLPLRQQDRDHRPPVDAVPAFRHADAPAVAQGKIHAQHGTELQHAYVICFPVFPAQHRIAFISFPAGCTAECCPIRYFHGRSSLLSVSSARTTTPQENWFPLCPV